MTEVVLPTLHKYGEEITEVKLQVNQLGLKMQENHSTVIKQLGDLSEQNINVTSQIENLNSQQTKLLQKMSLDRNHSIQAEIAKSNANFNSNLVNQLNNYFRNSAFITPANMSPNTPSNNPNGSSTPIVFNFTMPDTQQQALMAEGVSSNNHDGNQLNQHQTAINHQQQISNQETQPKLNPDQPTITKQHLVDSKNPSPMDSATINL